jgi:hypothetical protein
MRPYSLMIARFPALSQEHPDSSGYVMGLIEQLHNDDRVGEVEPWRLSDTPITMSRNRCVKEALDRGIDYLLMIDADMSPDCEPGAPAFWNVAWDFMMDRREKEADELERLKAIYSNPEEMIASSFAPATIAAPYCGPPPHESCYVFRWETFANVEVDKRFKLAMIDRDDAARRSGIEEVAALPTGLILYDLRLFKTLPAPWFEYEWTDVYRTHKASTEDVYQTRNASMMGFPQFCAWDCWAAHIKTKYVTKPRPLTVKAMKAELRNAILRSQ